MFSYKLKFFIMQLLCDIVSLIGSAINIIFLGSRKLSLGDIIVYKFNRICENHLENMRNSLSSETLNIMDEENMKCEPLGLSIQFCLLIFVLSILYVVKKVVIN